MTLFDSLFRTLIKSFSTDAKECFSQLENKMAPFLNSEEKSDEILESIFIDFPESNFNYQKIIEALISFASTDPVSILSNICDLFIKELNRTDDQASEIISIHVSSFCVPNFYFYHFVHHLNLKILTDLIKIFFIHFPSKQLVQKIVNCGYKLCASSISEYTNNLNDSYFNPLHTIFSRTLKNNNENIFSNKRNNYFRNKSFSDNRLSKLKFQLIKSWSTIFHHISKISMDVISFALEQYSDYVSSGHIFTLVSKVYADPPFIELLLYILQNCQKHNQITAEMLSSLTSLFLIVKDISEKVLVDFFTVIWTLKSHPKLKEEAIELICVLFNRLPKFQLKANQFYYSKIYVHADNDKKVKRSANAFLFQIRGDVSKLTIEGENPQFFNSSGNPPNDSFAVIFIKTFFERSNFNVCVHLFGQILAHLASIDIFTFERIIVPNFVKLDFLSPRFASMAVALNIMNSDTFLNENLCKSTEAKINEINSYFKQKIIDSFSQLLSYTDVKYMVLTRKVQKYLNKIENADNFLTEFISKNSLQKFDQTSKPLKTKYIDDELDVKNISLETLETKNKNNENNENQINQTQNETEQKNTKPTKSRRFSIKKPNKFSFFLKNKNKENETKDSNSLNNEELNTIETVKSNIELKNDKLSFDSIAQLIQSIPLITDLEVLKNTDISIIIIHFMCHYDKEVAKAANEAYSNFLKIEGSLEVIVNKILSNLMKVSEEVACQCLYLLNKTIKKLTKSDNSNNNDDDSELKNDSDFYYSLKKKNRSLKVLVNDEFYHKIEIHSFCSLVFDSPYCRSIAFDILKRLSIMKVGFLYNFFHEKSTFLNKAFNRSVLLSKNPFNLSIADPIIGKIDIENACCCRFNDLWLCYFSNMINTLMNSEQDMTSFIASCGEIIHDIFFTQITNFTRIAASIIYIDSFYCEANISIKSKNSSSSKGSKTFDISSILDFDSELDMKDSQKIKMTDFSSILGLLNSNNKEKKKKLIQICSFLNGRVLQRILPELLNVDNDLYPDVAESFIFLIRNSEDFDDIISSIFPLLVKFLKLLQNYFQFLDINSTREIVWDEPHIDLLKKHQNLCINYCILTSLMFDSNQEQNKEHVMPLIYRQVQLKFLIHWSQLPTDSEPEFNQLKSYSLNTLVLIIKAGPAFIEGYLFDSSFFDVMVHCEKNGNQVLYSLLNNQINILMSEFVKNSLIRTKEENLMFLGPILNVLENIKESSLIEKHIGSIILLSNLLKKMKNKSYISILSKLDNLFVSLVGFKVDNDKKKSKIDKYSKLNITKHFEFATEQIIESGLNIIQEIKDNINLFKSIVESIHPLFNKIHILPNKQIIIQGIPSKYRTFTCYSFFNLMFNISEKLDEEKLESFSYLWHEILQSSDNSSIVLLLLFENNNSEMKKKLFINLLDKDPSMITDFLSKRCTFAYWYFMKTQKNQEISSITWIIPVLTRAFTYFFDYVSNNFIDCLHFSFLFIEECKELFEVLLSIFQFESVDSDYVWSSEGPNEIVQAAYIISEVSSILTEKNQNEIINWSQEAIRWCIGCNDIKVGYRSLFILRMLQTEISQSLFPLFAKATAFHLSRISESYDKDDEEIEYEEKVSLFIGECFTIFHRQMSNLDLPTFAFRFASLFVKCKFLNNSCLKKAMPIFIACTKHMVLMSTAKKIIVDAFVPFLPDLESSSEAQEIFLQISDLNTTPELFIVAASFMRKNLPFISVLTNEQIEKISKQVNQSSPNKNTTKKEQQNKTETKTKSETKTENETEIKTEADTDTDSDSDSESDSVVVDSALENKKIADLILSIPFKISSIIKAMKLFGKLLYTSSFPLTESILDICSILLNHYENDIDSNVLIPIFLFAIKNVSSMKGAKNFIQVVLQVNPHIVKVIADRYSLNFTVIKHNFEESEYYDDYTSSANTTITTITTTNDSYESYEDDDDEESKTNKKNDVDVDVGDANFDENQYEEGSDVYFQDSSKFSLARRRRRLRNKKSGNARPADVNFINLNLNINMNSNHFLDLNEGTIENRKKMIDNITKELIKIDENQAEVVPITSCKQLLNLNGMIDQSAPPKISPFAPQLEMVLTVMKDDSKLIKRTNSHGRILFQLNTGRLTSESNSIGNSSNSMILVSPSSPILPSLTEKTTNIILATSEKNLKLDLIQLNRPIIKEFLNVDESMLEFSKFVVNPKEFLELKE